MTRLEYALALAKLGFRIFPLQPGTKLPYLTEKWKEIRTTDETIIRGWFAERMDMNYAVNPADNQVIIDLDEGVGKDGHTKRGILNFGELEAKSADFDDSKFDDTLVVSTPRGGLHGYFDHCPKAYAISVGKDTQGLVADVDVRGPDGYVVGPGSITVANAEKNTAAGVYQVITTLEEIKTLPGWLGRKLDDAVGTTRARDKAASVAIVELDTPSQIKRAMDVLRKRSPAIEGQGGDDHTYATVCHVKDEGISEDKCVELMCMEPLSPGGGPSWNDTCQPPWEVYEIALKAANAYRYGNRRPGAKADLLACIGMEDIEGALDEGEIVGVTAPVDDPLARIRESEYRGSRALLEREVNTDMIAPEWIPAFGYTAIKAKRGTGKTVFMYDLACRLACDMNWHNGVELDKDWAVVYLCGEDDIGLQLHVEAWTKTYNKEIDSNRLIFYTMTPDLMSGPEVAIWARVIREAVGNRRVVTFLDTWQRATSRASQNDDREMQTAIHNATNLVKELGGPMIIACHPPKSNPGTISGAFVIENHSTCIIHIEDEGIRKRATVERIKGPGEKNYFGLEYKCVDLGRTDKFKKKVTGLVPMANSGTGMSMSPQLLKEMKDTRVMIGQELLPQMEKGAITFKDAGAWLYRYAKDHPATKIGTLLNSVEDEQEATKRLHDFFPTVCETVLEDSSGVACVLVCNDKKLMLAGEKLNPTSSPEVPERWELKPE
jgi:hypothetical protein